MSLQIIKAGISDTVQDGGRYGYQHLGINPGGAIDRFSACLANALLGKDLNAPVLELHFPASGICFNKDTLICLTGGNFTAQLQAKECKLKQPIAVKTGDILTFAKQVSGARAYLAIKGNMQVEKWLNSYSTNVKAKAGGYKGRALATGDLIEFGGKTVPATIFDQFNPHSSWYAYPPIKQTEIIEVLPGNEWNNLTDESKELLSSAEFTISKESDRMGFRLIGPPLEVVEQIELVSSGVNFGTIQLLPNKQLIVLMADHQTMGGYPRLASVISADLPTLAQMQPNKKIRFKITDIERAEALLLRQHQYLVSVQWAAHFKLNS